MRAFLSRTRRNRADSMERALNPQEPRRPIPRTTGLPRVATLTEDGSNSMHVPMASALFYPPSLSHGRYPEPLEPAPAHLARSASLPMPQRGRRRERRGRTTRGADIDAYGRRGGRPDSDDWDGEDKEELPAYESVDVRGPPRYNDVNMGMHYVGETQGRVLALPLPTLDPSMERTEVERERERERAVERALQTMPGEGSADRSASHSPHDRTSSFEPQSAMQNPRTS